MKIVHVLNHFLPETIAGTEIYVMSLIKELEKLGASCSVIIPNYKSFNIETYSVDGVNVVKYAEPSVTDRSLIMGKRQPDGLSSFLDVIKKEKPYIVHFHELAGSNGITLHHVKAVKEAGFRTLMTLHLSGYSCMTGNLMYKDKEKCDGIIRIKRCTSCYLHVKKSPALSGVLTPLSMLLFKMGLNTTRINNRSGTALGTSFLVKKLKRDLLALGHHCDRIVTLTDWYKTMLVDNNINSHKISVIKQALPGGLASVADPVADSVVLKIIFIGRISRFKGIDILINAVKSIKGKIELDIYGQVCEEDYALYCKTISADMQNVRWQGTIPPEEVVSTIKKYSLLCLPSAFSEMSPLVIQEAFAAGVPVLASDVYGNAEQIKEGINGWLFKFKDVHSLSIKLQQLVDEPSEITKVAAFKNKIRTFNDVASEYEMIYTSLCNSSPG